MTSKDICLLSIIVFLFLFLFCLDFSFRHLKTLHLDLKALSEENKKAYNEQRNRCVMLQMPKKSHYSHLDIKNVNDNEKFWKIVKPLFSEKVTPNENITQVDNNNIICSDIEIAERLNAFFSNVVKELNIKIKEDLLCDVSSINDPVERAIQMIKENFDNGKTFSFDLFSPDTIFKEIVSLDTNKSTHSNNVLTKIVKVNADLFSIIFVSNAFVSNPSLLVFCYPPLSHQPPSKN